MSSARGETRGAPESSIASLRNMGYSPDVAELFPGQGRARLEQALEIAGAPRGIDAIQQQAFGGADGVEGRPPCIAEGNGELAVDPPQGALRLLGIGAVVRERAELGARLAALCRERGDAQLGVTGDSLLPELECQVFGVVRTQRGNRRLPSREVVRPGGLLRRGLGVERRVERGPHVVELLAEIG